MLSVAFWGLHFASARPLDSQRQMGAGGCSAHSSLAVLSSRALQGPAQFGIQPEMGTCMQTSGDLSLGSFRLWGIPPHKSKLPPPEFLGVARNSQCIADTCVPREILTWFTGNLHYNESPGILAGNEIPGPFLGLPN